MRPARPVAVLLTLMLACGAAACRGEKPAAPVAAAEAPRAKEQAMALLMAVPEVKAWSARIEQESGGAAHAALVEDEPGLQTVGARRYWQLTFARSGQDAVQKLETFLVPETGDGILVRDFEKDRTVTLAQWQAAQRVVAKQ